MRRLALALSGLLLAAGCSTVATSELAPVLTPWQCEGATHRQVVEIRSDLRPVNPTAEFECAAPADAPIRVIDTRAPAVALPVFREGPRVTLQVPGELAAPRRLAVYWPVGPGLPASEILAGKPLTGDDYATTVHGDAWDFDEGDQEGIRSWGDRPNHYGEITVKDGVLTVPVTGKDPYCIWGIMFGDPQDQPPGHADTANERIDSGRYRYLRMRLRQNRSQAQWSFFFTDEKGQYQTHSFVVGGSEFQTVEFDLRETFPGFWDGRTMRSFRLDTTNDLVGATAFVDWIRIEAPAPEVRVGPVLSREAVLARASAKRLDVIAPKTVTAGQEARFSALVGTDGSLAALASSVPVVCELRDAETVGAAAAAAGGLKGRAADLPVAVGERAGMRDWLVGVQDDLGHPADPRKIGRLAVEPAALDHYVLVPSRLFVPVEGDRRVTVTVTGADRFGNAVPVRAKAPTATISDSGEATIRTFRGVSVEVVATCASQPLVTHIIGFADENGITGSCAVRTIGYRKSRIATTPTGYLTIDDALFLPLGGFYANWPSGLPAADGKISRSVDLFPCGPAPYLHGFPWPEEVEQKVVTYLDLCQKHGVTALRLMLRNMDIVGRVDPVQLQATLHLFDLGRARGLRFNVALFEDYTKPPYVTRDIIEKICLPHYTPAELAALPPHRARFLVDKRVVGSAAARYLDADAIRCQKDYLDELIPVLAGREEVLCYEFENEMVRPPMSWCREIAAYIRGIDPHTPVLGNPGPHEWPEPWRWRDSTVDLFSYHPYNDGRETADHGAVMFLRSKWAAASGIPFYTGEGGINQNRWQQDIKKVPNDFSMRGIRDQIWLSMACGANGAFLWTADCEAEMAEFAKVQPALEALAIDLRALPRRRPRVAMAMPDTSKANGNAHALAYTLLAQGVDFDTLPADEAKGYPVRIDAAAKELPAGLAPEFFAPAAGWQTAALVDADARQALVYLRNAAGGIGNYGEKRACWLRVPGEAAPELRIVGGRWSEIRAFDLDDGKGVPVTREGERVLLPAPSSHDFVLGFRR